MVDFIKPQDLHALLSGQGTLALLDVRDMGSYNSTHIPGSSSLPRHRIEYDLPHLVPFKGVTVVLCDDNGSQAELAAATLQRMGYTRVSVLDGGVNLWTSLDYPTEWGTNVPSKDFGERVEVEHRVSEIDSIELKKRVEDGEKLVILDTRTPEEYQNFSIPGGRSVPNGELVLHVTDILNELDADTTVIINCAGRTRSIIGARALQRMGIPNVYGLKNGTAGWALAGLELETGGQRLDLPPVSAEGEARAQAHADKIASQDGVRFMDVHELKSAMSRAARETVYLIDVRREEEYRRGHIPGFRWFPGGQAVQRADDVAAVRNGLIIFACDGRVRAPLVASWYRQMGFPNVYAVANGTTEWTAQGLDLEEGMPDGLPYGLAEAKKNVRIISPSDLRDDLPATVIFVGSSVEFAQGHVPGSHWVPRGWLELQIQELSPEKGDPIAVTCSNGVDSALAGAALRDMGYYRLSVMEDGMAGWQRAGFPMERGLSNVMTPPNDVVTMGPHRSYADTINYLRWEEALGQKYQPKG